MCCYIFIVYKAIISAVIDDDGSTNITHTGRRKPILTSSNGHVTELSTGRGATCQQVGVANRLYHTISCFLLLVLPCDLCVMAERER